MVEKLKNQNLQDTLQNWQARVLHTTTFIAQQLYKSGDLLSTLREISPYVGENLGIGRMAIFERQDFQEDEYVILNKQYEWHTAQREAADLPDSHTFQPTYKVKKAPDYQWYRRLNEGEIIYGLWADFESSDQTSEEHDHVVEDVVVLPLLREGKWWGVVTFDCWVEIYEWSQSRMESLRPIAELLGSIVYNGRILGQERQQLRLSQQISSVLQRQTDELAGLYEISNAITGVLEPRELLERLFRQVELLMDPDLVIMVFYDETLEEIEVAVAKEYGRPLPPLPVGMRKPVDEAGLTGWIIRQVKTILISDLAQEGTPAPLLLVTDEPRTWLGTPLLVNGRVIGAISVQSYTPHAFDRNDVRFVESLATQAAVAINSARLYQKEMQRRQVSERLHSLTTQLNSSLETQPILDKAIDSIRAIFPDSSLCTIAFYDEEKQIITPRAIWTINEEYVYVRVGQPIVLSETEFAGQCIFERQIIKIEDLHEHHLSNERTQDIINMGLRALLYIPIVINEKPIGMITIDFWHEPRRFNTEELALCEMATQHVVMAIKNARIYESEAKRRREAELLHQLTSYLVETSNVDHILLKAVELLHHYFPHISHCRFLIMDDSGEYLLPTKGWRDPKIPRPAFRTQPIRIDNTIATKQCIREKRPVMIADLLEELPSKSDSAQEFLSSGMRAILYVPLLAQKETIGMLQIDVWDQPYKFTAGDIALCQVVADHMAIGIERAELIESQWEQLQLLNTLREIGSLLTSSLKLEEVFERIFDLLARVIQYNTVSVQLFDEKRNHMWLAAGRGFKNLDKAADVVSQIGHRAVLLMGNQPFRIIKDTEQDAPWIKFEDFEPIRSSISCALRIKNKLVGVLNIDSFLPHAYDEKIAETAVAFANQAVIAIENGRLYDQLNQRALELSLLNQIAVMSAFVSNIDDLFEVATQIIGSALYRDNFGFLLLNQSEQFLVVHPSYVNNTGRKFPKRLPINSSLTGYVATTGEPFMGNTLAHAPRSFLLDSETQAELIVPLRVRGEVMGVINVEASDLNAFTERDLNFIQSLAGQLSIAIQRVQLYEDSHLYAAQLEDKVARRTAELQQQKDRMQAILDSVGEGVLFTDANNLILYANPAICAQSGYSSEELIGQNASFLSSDQSKLAEEYDVIWSTVAQYERWRGEFVNQCKDGSTYEVLKTISPVLDEHGQLEGFVSIQSDITHFKEVERLKSQFVSNVSHELRTPLTNIKTFLELLKRGRPEKRDHYMLVLEHEAERLHRLIQDLLDLSRLDTHAVKTELQPLAIEEMIATSVQAFQAKFDTKNIQWRYFDNGRMPTVLADVNQMQQVLANLLENAIAYTPFGGAVEMRLQTADYKNRPMVKIELSDNGIGINPDEIDHVFERFFRGHAAHLSRSPGTGLGLAITKEIITRHAGVIEVSSVPNEKTTFTLWLPMAS